MYNLRNLFTLVVLVVITTFISSCKKDYLSDKKVTKISNLTIDGKKYSTEKGITFTSDLKGKDNLKVNVDLFFELNVKHGSYAIGDTLRFEDPTKNNKSVITFIGSDPKCTSYSGDIVFVSEEEVKFTNCKYVAKYKAIDEIAAYTDTLVVEGSIKFY
ncbi:MAG: hypothetical protein KAH32_06860 [Chlamydiia bacterium]|nr:hypothetical protein [Chlamydiia bacterium]